MSLIPFHALRFGAERINNFPVSYSKIRVAGSKNMSYIMHSKAGSMPGQPDIFCTTSQSNPSLDLGVDNNQVIGAYKRDSCRKLHLASGPRDIETCPYGFTYDKYDPSDDESLQMAIEAAYRQVFGNLHPMDSELCIESHRRLRNGDISIREFIRNLAKSDFYKRHYFHRVNQQRCIELSFKHLLGRPPINQLEIISQVEILFERGYNEHIDALIDSPEYEEIFGSNTVPYPRYWNSPCNATTSGFNKMAILSRSFATSDNAIHGTKTSITAPAGKSQLLQQLSNRVNNEIKSLPKLR